MEQSAVFTVELSTPLGSIRGRVNVDSGPMRLADLVPTTHELTNILVERANRREENANRRISCRAGCGVCCCQMVALSGPEAFYLADLVESFPAQRRQELLSRFDEITEELDRQNLITDLLDPLYSDEVILPIAKKYFFLNKPCPFLVNQSCSIHPYRPVACREYNVMSPSEWCINPYHYEIAKVPMPLPLLAPLAILTAELTGSKPRLIPLTLGLRWGAEHAELRQRQWPGLELFQQFMAVLGRHPLLKSQ